MNANDFIIDLGDIVTNGKVEGKRLLICGEEYKAWLYDSYIFDAIEIAKNGRMTR